MGKLLGLSWRDMAACLAAFIVIHGILAIVAPCPYRDQMFVTVGHAGHEHHQAGNLDTAGTIPLGTPACPFQLTHAMYGVLQAAPAPIAKAPLLAPITIRLSVEAISPPRVLVFGIDPPPRIA